MHTKRASATRAKSCDFGPSLRLFLRGAPKGVFDRGGYFAHASRWEGRTLGPISGTGGLGLGLGFRVRVRV